MILDANVNLGECVYSDWELSPTLEAYRGWMEQNDVDGAVVAPLKPPSFDFEAATEELISTIEGDENLYGLARIDPRLNESEAQADRLLSHEEIVGLKLNPWEETFPITSTSVEPLLQVAAQHNVPVWIEAGYPAVSHALSIREVAWSYEDVEFVLTHGSHLDISGLSLADAMLLAQETENTFFELSGIYRHDFVQDIIEEVGSERVFFGSNSPYYHPTVELSRVQEADIDEGDREDVLGDSLLALVD